MEILYGNNDLGVGVQLEKWFNQTACAEIVMEGVAFRSAR